MARNTSRRPRSGATKQSNPMLMVLLIVALIGGASIGGLWVWPQFRKNADAESLATQAELALRHAQADLAGLKGQGSSTGDFAAQLAQVQRADTFVDYEPIAEGLDAANELKVRHLSDITEAASTAASQSSVALQWTSYAPAGLPKTLRAVSFTVTLTGTSTTPRDFIAQAAQRRLVLTIIDANAVPSAGLDNAPDAASPTTQPRATATTVPAIDAPNLTPGGAIDWTLTVALWFSSEPPVDVSKAGKPATTAPPSATPSTTAAAVATSSPATTSPLSPAVDAALAAVVKDAAGQFDAAAVAASVASQTAPNVAANVQAGVDAFEVNTAYTVTLGPVSNGTILGATVAKGTCTVAVTFGTTVGAVGTLGAPSGC